MDYDPLIGRQLANFRVERPLGQGGMAMVYYGRDVKLDRPVAIKIINTRFQRDTTYAQRLVQEARAIANWRHEHIIQVYFADDADGLSYFVMEYIDGQNLEQILADYKTKQQLMPHNDVLRMGRAIADALDYAHRKGVIHRDVKPGNVMVAQDGRIVLMDFGLALDVTLGSLGETFGSARYIAPEQAQKSDQAVPQSDLYALGVMLYEMLTGYLPFDDPSPTSLALQHINQPPPSPRAFNPQLNALAESVLLKALHKSPLERYQTGRELLDALEQALAKTAVSSDDLLGQQLDEYRLDTLLGQGGMARIYRGYDVRLKRHVAIKVIDASLRTDTTYRTRFEREAQAIGQLEHPHIVRLYRYGEVAGLFYMAMQYVEGNDLRTRLAHFHRQHSFMPFDEVARLIQALCAALDYAHSKNIIHRDVKPSNIMLDETGQLFLTDFGLVLLEDSGTKGQVFGSPLYVAPEQVMSSANAGPKSDLYSVGVILYEMLTGHVPFDSENALQLAMQHMSDPPPSPRNYRPDLSPALEAVVLRSLEKEPDKRFPSGAALSEAVTSAVLPSPAPKIKTGPLPELAAEPSVQNIQPQRELPPIPAAVAVAESPPPAPLPSVPASKPRWRKWAIMGLSTAVLLMLVSFIWFYLLNNNNLLGLAVNTAVPVQTVISHQPPSSTATNTPLVIPLSPTPTPTPQPPATNIPSLPTASSTATTAPTHTPTRLPTLTPSPTHPFTPSPSPTATPVIIQVREQDGMSMVLIPAGTFMMGAAEGDIEAEVDERPLHAVTVSSFYLDQYEVSVAQYAAFLNEMGTYVNMCNGYTCLSTQFETTESYLALPLSGGYQAEAGFEDYPINNVSWHGASAYCAWVGGRLPTEAEWEWAARGENGRLYPWGSEPPDETTALFNTTFDALQSVDALPAGASPFTIFGLAGGVWEWTADAYDESYYAISPAENPTGPEVGIYAVERVLRGGSFASEPSELRATNRQVGDARQFLNVPDIGFRCAVPLEE